MFEPLQTVLLRERPDFMALAVADGLVMASLMVWFARHARGPHGGNALTWSIFRGVTAGAGGWSAQFIAMQAYQPGVHATYHPILLILSLLVAIAATPVGIRLAMIGPPRLAYGIARGACGLGFTAANLILVAAYHPQARVGWDGGYLVASTVFGAGLIAAGHWITGRNRAQLSAALGVLLITAGLLGAHFLAVAALRLTRDAAIVVPGRLTEQPALVGMAVILSLLIVVSSVAVTASEATSRRTSLKRLQAALDAMPAAIALYDRDDRLLAWNRGFVALRPFPAQVEMRAGDRFEDQLRQGDLSEDRIAAVLVERRALTCKEFKAADGRMIRFESSTTDDGGLISVGVDITALKEQAEVLERARDAAEAANRVKTTFLANMSHEIRTPLNGVTGIVGALAATPLNEQQREMLDIIARSAQTVDVLLSDLLELARFEAGEAASEPVRFILADEIRAAAGGHQARAASKGLEFGLELEGAEVAVMADAPRLRQVVGNLLNNAVKFTESGRIVVFARALGNDRYHIGVRDTGIGFDPGDADRLFQRFVQADTSMTRKHGGAGLGLAIAQECAALLGGTLDATSESGRGSTFTLEVVLPAAAEAVEASEAPAAWGAREDQAQEGVPPEDAGHERAVDEDADEPFRVLVVDDNPTNRKVLELILTQIGAAFVSAEDGQQAVNAFLAQPFGAVLMDIQMPVMDGIAATREIRRIEHDQHRPHTPLVIVSANCLPEHLEAGRRAGADRHLAKPINAADLIGALSELCAANDDSQAA